MSLASFLFGTPHVTYSAGYSVVVEILRTFTDRVGSGHWSKVQTWFNLCARTVPCCARCSV